jgi:uncharacterized protein YjiS (DUF1127 family)
MISQPLQHRNQEREKLFTGNDAGDAAIGVDAQDRRDLWRRFMDALYEGRMRSARREIARHRDTIAFLRRHLVERKEHLHLVPGQASNACVPGTSERRFQPLGRRVRAVFIAAPQIIAQWRRRVRIRNELVTLNDGDLRDIRWTRAEVEAECRKPFWRA